MKTILIVSHTHLCRNPRVLKEAFALNGASYKVNILTAIYSQELLDEDNALLAASGIDYSYYSDLRHNNVTSLRQRLVRKVAVFLKRRLNIETAQSLGYGFAEIKKYCLNTTADLYIMHQELPLLVGNMLLKKGKNVAFDLEDWYSEDLLPDARAGRAIKLLKIAERNALLNGSFCLTTSHVMAKKMASAYHSNVPYVIYNTFAAGEQKLYSSDTKNKLKLVWFSQTVGPGRGLEDFIFLSDKLITSVEIHLIGTASPKYRESLEAILPAKHQLFFHPQTTEELLRKKINDFDIGLALEPLQPLNKDYTISNKFFQYLMSGLPVIATRTAGQIEAFEKYQPGILINLPALNTDIENLNSWLNNSDAVKKSAEAAQEAAQEYNWENESVKLLKIVEKALNE